MNLFSSSQTLQTDNFDTRVKSGLNLTHQVRNDQMSETQQGFGKIDCSKTNAIILVNAALVTNITFGGLNRCHHVDSATYEPSAAVICGT